MLFLMLIQTAAVSVLPYSLNLWWVFIKSKLAISFTGSVINSKPQTLYTYHQLQTGDVKHQGSSK